jgi:hypothetical protein
MAKRLQVIPLEVLLDEQPQPEKHERRRVAAVARFLHRTWTGWFPTRKESTVAAVCFLLQTLLLGLLLTFDLQTDFASLQEWEKIGVGLYVYGFAAHPHPPLSNNTHPMGEIRNACCPYLFSAPRTLVAFLAFVGC